MGEQHCESEQAHVSMDNIKDNLLLRIQSWSAAKKKPCHFSESFVCAPIYIGYRSNVWFNCSAGDISIGDIPIPESLLS